MAKLFDEIDDSLRAFIEAQPMFFVATAPSGDGGHVNLSPKGGRNLFRVTGPLGYVALATVIAFVVGYAAIAWFLRYLAHHSVRLFVIYRLLLGSLVLILVAAGAIS